MTFLQFPERDAWRKTLYQIMTLFRIHREFYPEKFKPEPEHSDTYEDFEHMLDIM